MPRPPTTAAATNPRWTPELLDQRRREERLPNETPLLWTALATGAGAAIESAIAPQAWVCFFVSGAALAGWLALWRARSNVLAAWLLLGSIGCLACGWNGYAWRLFPVDDLGRFAPRDAEPVCFEAVVLGPVDHYPAEPRSPFRAIPSTDRTVITLRATRLRDGIEWRAASGRCEVSVQGDADSIRIGQQLRVYGQLSHPPPALNPGQRDSAARARADRRLCRVSCEAATCVQLIEGELGVASFASRCATASRDYFAKSIDRTMPPQRATIARAMLLGDLSGLPRETVEAFRWTGTLHLLVVSGLHVGLVASPFLLAAALGWLPARVALLSAIVATVCYAAVTGGQPPAVRAAFVVAAACLAALTGRRPLGVNSLSGAALAVFIASPGAWQAIGTQLSFLAAATLLGVARWAALQRSAPRTPIERLVEACRPWRSRFARGALSWAAWVLAATLAVMVVSGPLLAKEFHLISPAAAPLSLATPLLVLPTVIGGLVLALTESSALLLGQAAAEWLSVIPAWLCGWSAESLSKLVSFAAQLPMAGFYTPGPEPWWPTAWIGWAALSALSTTMWRRASGAVMRLGLLLIVAGFAPLLYRTINNPHDLEISFLAVGHGSAVLIETPEGGALLYDCGALGAPERTTDLISRALWSRGVRRLDGVFLSHPDVDHYNALPGLIERFEIAGVWTSARMFPLADDPGDRSGPAELKRVLRAHGVAIHELKAGDRLANGGVAFEVLHPDLIGVAGSDNANSLVLSVEHMGQRALLTGDLEGHGLEWLMSQERLACQVLAAPHHGSLRSDPPGLADWCRPAITVISSGKPNPATGAAYRASGASVLNTHDGGIVSIALAEAGCSWRQPLAP